MYRAPENSNRVKAMRLKFESQEVTVTTGGKQNNNNLSNGCTEPTKPKIKVKARSMEDENTSDRNSQPRVLGRQLSDPVKRNIKRTPAFRLDKNSFIEKDHIFQRNASVRNQLARLNDNCDNKVSCNNITNEMNDVEISNTQKTESQNSLSKRATLSHLYSEAIPKSKRISHMTTTKNEEFDEIHDAMTLQLNKSPTKQNKNDRNSIQTAKNVIEILENLDSLINGSDTIKTALKRPLPPGPAPKKPPRTFQHSPQHSQKEISKSDCNLTSIIQEDDFTKKLNDNLQKQITRTKSPKKDPKYMLEKLENALKTNKIKLRQQKFDFGSDDDDEKRTLKSATNSPLLKRLNNLNIRSSSSQRLNFNCLNSFVCSGGTSANSDDANNSFSNDVNNGEEPIYAEPFQYDEIIRKGSLSNSPVKEKPGKPQRNSLYYMSSPVLGCLDVTSTTQNSSFLDEQQDTNEHQVNNSSGSQSTFSSDTDSNVSTPVDFTTTNSNSAFVKDLIKSFEDKDKDTATNSVQLRKSTEVKCSNGDANGHRYAVVCPVDGKTSGNVQRAASKFEIYVRTVRTFSAKKMSNKNLFHCCLLVGLDGKRPYIKSKFPADIEVPAYIEALCFPDSEDVHINYSAKEQCYLLVITDASGDRIYGYCRRVLPEGSSTCLPLAYCILTKHRAPRFYKRILEELESHHGLPDKKRNDLFNEFYQHDFPKPGHSIRLDLSNITRHEVKYYDSNFERKVSDAENNNEDRKFEGSAIDEQKCPHGIVNLARSRNNGNAGDECPICSGVGRHELVLTLHQDMRYEETDLKELCETLDVGLLQKVFENLLLERKVIFTSGHLSKLSSCIEAIQSVLYPFSWPHAFIPVLPKTRWEIVEAPAPLICGVLSNKVIDEHKVENGIVVDLDSKTVLLEVEDDEKILPCCAIKSWKKGLDAANSISTSVNEDNVLLSDAFIRVFIQTCGHYKEFISNNTFDKEGFKAFPKSKGIRRFLQWFTQTTMFDLFIDAVLTNPDSFYIFNSRIKIYSSQDATLILEKMKDWKKV